jgi:hypothetical protein
LRLAARATAAPAALLALALLGVAGACQPTAPAIDMTDPRVAAGPQRSCAELELTEVRCTLVTLRGATLLEEQRPDHPELKSGAVLHEAETASGQSPLPENTTVPAVVVFTTTDGSRIGVPVLCPVGADESDPACDPRTE